MRKARTDKVNMEAMCALCMDTKVLSWKSSVLIRNVSLIFRASSDTPSIDTEL